MDELTRERFGQGVPYHEAHTRPTQLRRHHSPVEVSARRIALCGTDDLTVQDRGGDRTQVKNRRLLEVIRQWRA